MLLIKNGHIKPVVGSDLQCGCVLIDDSGKIAAIGTDLDVPKGTQIIDAEGRLVTPGCVEAHCHTGMHTESIRWEGDEINESVDPVTPHLRAFDGINPACEYFRDGLRGGVTTVCTGPGSANVIGGTFSAIKLYGTRIDDMIVKHPVAMKCALGENPKNRYGQINKRMPKTRMGSAAVLREVLFKTQRYMADRDAGKNPAFDMKLEAMIPVLKGEIPLKCHAHRADDILTSIRIAKEFGVRLTLDHCTEGHLIVDELAKEGYPALVGPTFGGKSKPEVKNKSYETAAILNKAGVKICIITDAGVIPIHYLPMCAGLAASHGLDKEEAWKAITINPAQVLGIENRVGSLEPGKDADIIIWTADPLTAVGAHAYTTIVDGKIAYQD